MVGVRLSLSVLSVFIFFVFKVVAVQLNTVKPHTADMNENVLSEQCRAEIGLTEEMVKNGQPLEHVLEQVVIIFICRRLLFFH